MTEGREHEWFTYGRLNWECCRVCGIVRRKDGKNSPCKGPVFVGPRDGVDGEQAPNAKER